MQKHLENASDKHSNMKEKEIVKNNENKEEGSIYFKKLFNKEEALLINFVLNLSFLSWLIISAQNFVLFG
jgi:hypothetical protein